MKVKDNFKKFKTIKAALLIDYRIEAKGSGWGKQADGHY